MPFKKIFTSTASYPASEYIGRKGDVFYDIGSGLFRISDGKTIGGKNTYIPGGINVTSVIDLPEPVDGVITLGAGNTYYINDDIDLHGNRLETGGVVTIIGTSSETASITSTGLADGVPLLTSRYTIPIRYLTFRDVDTACYIDDDGGANAPLAIDWIGVNFLNVTNVGELGTVDNFIYDTGAFLGSQNLRITGQLGTFGVFNSLFRGDGTALPIIDITATAVIGRRFRIIYSSVVGFGSTIGINVEDGATIPIEGFILDTVNFSGGGVYLAGITTNDESSLFVNCVGVLNTTAIAQMYMKENAVETGVTVQSARYPVLGVTETTTAFNQKFTHIQERNSLRYESTIKRLFRVSVTFTLLAPQNNVIGVYIGKTSSGTTQDGDLDRRTESEVYITTTGSRPDAAAIQTILELEHGDEVYMIVQNTSGTGNVTVQFMNMIIERTN